MNTPQLFQIFFKVRPAIGHPLYYDIQYGVLTVFCYGLTIEEAATFASEMVEVLPYEIIGENPTGMLSNAKNEDKEWKKTAAAEARQIGVAFRLHCVETGMGDESDLLQ